MKQSRVSITIAKILFSIICLTSSACALKQLLVKRHSDVGLNVKQLITKYGYPFENFTVLTADGYILELHRIPHGRNNISKNRSPVLVVPGLVCSSADWVNMGPKNSLGFILADEGYDVWLANYRGTTWSRKHVTLDPDKDKKEFWNYSFHEIGYYDLPAFIDFILDVTGYDKLFYVGHSQGTTTFFVLTSERPEYNNKIRLAIALGPAVYVDHTKSLALRMFDIFRNEIQEFSEKYQFYEILPHSSIITLLGQLLCKDESPYQDVCADLFYFAAGRSEELNKTMIPVITSNAPAGSAMKQVQHFTQFINSRLFRQYDYGKAENLIKYGQPTPPKYDLKKVKSPVGFYYGDKDVLCVIKDVERAANQLPNLVAKELVRGFNHIDFMWGIDVVKLVYNNILELMKHY